MTRARRLAIAVSSALVVATVDQVTKAAALELLSTDERIPVLGGLLGLQLAFNAGTVLSFGSGATWLLTTLAAIVSFVVMPIAAFRARTSLWATGLGLVWGGAIGNLIDRLVAEPGFGRGRVTDFLAYGDLFIGNLADIALAVGAAVLGVQIWREARQNGHDSTPAEPPVEETSSR
ncbi:signal peptidase II [Cellulomonas sp. Y8]|uniref:signal peptidase II n=1 Tax=Cellulomonas sp. Y8 TaxID=2591145 RepID=UPI003D71299A